MTEFLLNLGPGVLWAPSFFILSGINLLISLVSRPWGRARWLLALAMGLIPLSFPSANQYAAPAYGMLSTVMATLIVVSAARLADLDRFQRSVHAGVITTYLWMSLPMMRSLPASAEDKAKNRKGALPRILRGFFKRLCWEPFGYVCQQVAGEELPWPVRSAFVMLYFVLNMTAIADVVGGICLFFGLEIDESFEAPFRSVSPREFWGRRWNKFINRFALKHVGIPLARKLPPGGVVFAVFAASGIFHEYFAWSVSGSNAKPGPMMLFFLIQGAAVWLAQRWPISLARPLSVTLTYIWMVLTAPLFFMAVEPALRAFGYPSAWLP